MIHLLTGILTTLARIYRWRYRPVIVGVTGNAGKTSTKEAIAAVLRTKYRVRATGGNLNNDLGLPTTIIGDFSADYYRSGGTPRFWLSVLWQGCWGLWFRRDVPDVLVLEYGADRPGDIRRLARAFPPDIAVVTRVGEMPVHGEFFASPKELAAEKAQLVRALAEDGHAVLNYDDQTVLDMRSVTRARVSTYGFAEGADVRAAHLQFRSEGVSVSGISFDLSVGDTAMPVVVRGTIGRGVASSCAAAVAVGHALGVGLADAVDALCHLVPAPGRMRLIAGIKHAMILDDTYNASPAAVHLALDTVKELSGRKLVVLGDMRELGTVEVQAHQAIGTLAASIADELVCVGARGAFIADAAGNQMSAEHIHRCSDSREAAMLVQQLLHEGDVVLVKGSQSMRMERIVKEIMAEPDRAGELLVRQSISWLNT